MKFKQSTIELQDNPPIEVQYLNKDLKKLLLISCMDFSLFSKIWCFLFLHMVHLMQCGCNLPHNPIIMTSKHPSLDG